MLAALYLAYVIVLAKMRPDLMPPLTAEERAVPLPSYMQQLTQRGKHALVGLLRPAPRGEGVPRRTVFAQLMVTLLPAMVIAGSLVMIHRIATNPATEVDTAGLEINTFGEPAADAGTGLAAPPDGGTGLAAPPPTDTGLAVPPSTETGLAAPPPSSTGPEVPGDARPAQAAADTALTPVPASEAVVRDANAGPVAGSVESATEPGRLPTPTWFWIMAAIGALVLLVVYVLWTWERLQVFKMLLSSFFPLALLILAVLGSIVFGFATPTEAAAVGAFGGFVLAAVYRMIEHWRSSPHGKAGATLTGIRELGSILKESSFLTAKTTAMVCWLFVGSAIFSAAFALLGGQELVETWVLSLDLTPVQFMILAQFIIFILGWPLEWTEIIVIFMPIFIPLLPHFNIDPLFFGLLVALNLQTAFLSPPVAMSAFYLKGVAPPHVTLNQIFAGMIPFMGIQVIALVLLYVFPGIGLWLPQVLYK
jgi:TRAP-type mannitol/chloroaromatic compound transport system permease large subunit